jgi:DNA-binding MarR family transcriptional regulator
MATKKSQNLAFRLRVLASIALKLTRQDLEKKLKREHIDISPLAWAAMLAVSRKRCTIGTLSKKFMIAPASLVPVIDALDRMGLMKRGTDPNDRRRNPLSLTHKGEQVLSRVLKVTREDILVRSLSRLGELKSSQLIGLLEELVIILSGDKDIGLKVSGIALKRDQKQTLLKIQK